MPGVNPYTYHGLDVLYWTSTPPKCTGPLPAPYMWPPNVSPREYDRYPSLSAFCYGDPRTFTDEPMDSSISLNTQDTAWRDIYHSNLPQSLYCRCLDRFRSNQRVTCTAPFAWSNTDGLSSHYLEPDPATGQSRLYVILERLIQYCADRCVCIRPVEPRPMDFNSVISWREKRAAQWKAAQDEAAIEDPNACGRGEECQSNNGLTEGFKEQCDQPCNGWSDCGDVRATPGCGDKVACEYRDSTPALIGKLGICVGIAVFAGLRPGKERLGLLGGRDVDDMMCVCNSTFVSSACCIGPYDTATQSRILDLLGPGVAVDESS